MSAATPGLVVAATDPISSFLSCADLASEPAVPYRSIWCAGSSSHCRPPLRQLLRGKGSDELKARLHKLREMQERREYAEVVRDVAPKKEDNPEPFSSYKDQLRFGLHVVVIMFTGYLVGFAAFRALFSNSPLPSCNCTGMLLEASSVPRSKKLQ